MGLKNTFILNKLFLRVRCISRKITLFNVSKAACAAIKAGSAFSKSSAHNRCFKATSSSISFTLCSSSAAKKIFF